MAAQQERLRSLGRMASGIAHDINNALTPATLYTQSLLDHDRSLSADARNDLRIVQQAIEDVARTVGRIKDGDYASWICWRSGSESWGDTSDGGADANVFRRSD